MEHVREDSALETGGLLLRFVNTRPIVQPIDHLGNADVAKEWFVKDGSIDDDALVTDADAASARELRTALVTLLKAHVGIEEEVELESAERVLERFANMHQLVSRLGVREAKFEAAESGVAGALGGVLADTTTLALDEREWVRFKACKNPACYRGFRDNSRPGSALYCSHTCASQVGMRAYRERKAS